MTEDVTMKPRTRVIWTAAERAEWLALFECSGQTAAEFCRRNDLSLATLYFWLRQQRGTAVAEDGALVEVPLAVTPVPDRTAAAHVVGLQLPSGLRLQVPVGVDTAWLGALLQSLAVAKV